MKKLLSLAIVLILVFTSLVQVSADTVSGLSVFNDKTQDLVVAYLGGSITEGSGASSTAYRYATLVTKEYFAANRTGKVTEINAGVGGTGSEFGMQRINKDVMYANPDIVFVEFAVNDSSTNVAQTKSNMENIVRKLQTLPKKPVIIFLYTTSSAPSSVASAAEAMHEVAQAYDIGEIDLNSYIHKDFVVNNDYVWQKQTDGVPANSLTRDGTHPNDAGYRVYADRIKQLFTENPEEYFKDNKVLDYPLFTVYNYANPVCVDTNSGTVGQDRVVRANYKTITEAGLSSGASLRDVAAVLENGMLITDGAWENTSTINDGTYSSSLSKHMDVLSVSKTAGDKMYYKFTGRGIGIYGANGPKGGNININIYKPDDLENTVGKATVGRYQNLTYYKPAGEYGVKNLEFGEYIAVFETTSNSSGGNVVGIGYIMVDNNVPVILPEAKDVYADYYAYNGVEITVSYRYDGHSVAEGSTKFVWEGSDAPNGTFTAISGETAASHTPTGDYKYIRCGVTPINKDGIEGKTVYSNIVRVVSGTVASISASGDYEADSSAVAKAGISKTKAVYGKSVSANGAVVSGDTYYVSVMVKPDADTTVSLSCADSVIASSPAKGGEWTRVYGKYTASSNADVTVTAKADAAFYADDFMCAENTDVMPMVGNIEISSSSDEISAGSTLIASAQCYNVNADASEPEVSYGWQKSYDGVNWTDVNTTSTLDLTAEDEGTLFRVVVTAKNAANGFEVVDSDSIEFKFSGYDDILLYKDMDSKQASSGFSSRYSSYSKLALDETAGLNKTAAYTLTRTEGYHNLSGNDVYDRVMNSAASKINIKAGHTYFVSSYQKTSRPEITTLSTYYLATSNSPTASEKHRITGSFIKDDGTTNGTYTNNGYVNYNKNTLLTGEWKRYSVGFKVDSVFDNNGVSVADSSSTSPLWITFGGAGTAGNYPEGTDITTDNPLVITIDDYFILEVPNDDVLYNVLPRVAGVEIDYDYKMPGSKITADADYYDVNFNADVSATYVWQRNENGIWKDIAQGESYTIRTSDLGYEIRVIATAKSVDSFGIAKTHSAVSDSITPDEAVSEVKKIPVFEEGFEGGTVTAGTIIPITTKSGFTINRQTSSRINTVFDSYDADLGKFVFHQEAKGEVNSQGNPNPAYITLSKVNQSLFSLESGKKYSIELGIGSVGYNSARVYVEFATNYYVGSDNTVPRIVLSGDAKNIPSDTGIACFEYTFDADKITTSAGGAGDEKQTANVNSISFIAFDNKPLVFDYVNVYEVVSNQVINVEKTGLGKIYIDGSEMADGALSTTDSSKTVKIVPDAGFEVESVTYNGTAVELNSNGEATIMVVDGATLSVVFKGDVREPSVTAGTPVVSKNYSYDFGGTTGVVTSKNTVIMYGAIDMGYGYGTLKTAGFYIKKLDEDGNQVGDTLTLPAVSTIVGNAYGIRVIGSALTAGDYAVIPYIITSDNAEYKGVQSIVTVE